MTKKSYDEEAIKFSKVIDIAMETFEKFPPEIWSEEVLHHVKNTHIEWKKMALNPQPIFKRITSLNYLLNDFLIYFQENNGKDVEYFWKEIKTQNLNYVREDKLGKIMKRGKINNRIEFEYATDIIVVAEQEKRITEGEAKKLAEMIGEFELRKRK